MESNRIPIGLAYIDRCGGWRYIYAAREVRRGKHKGWFEVFYIDLRDGKPQQVKATVPDYRTREGEQVHGRKETV